MNEYIQQIVNNPSATLLIIGNLILIESLLSVDNAAVLATMVMNLPEQQRAKALKYGIVGAYVFRGICLLLANSLVKIWWLKGLGGIYLMYLSVNWWLKSNKQKNDTGATKSGSILYRRAAGPVGVFWATVISVELMDLAFSLDNVFAAVAFSGNLIIVMLGVFIGILAMRFVAQAFVRLIEHYPFLEACAFTVIGILGIKLALSFYEYYNKNTPLTNLLNSDVTDWVTSAITIGVFVTPIITSRLFNFPKKAKK